MNTIISESDRKELQLAKKQLENPGVAIKITNIIGMPIEKGIEKLPKNWGDKIGEITKKALLKASDDYSGKIEPLFRLKVSHPESEFIF